uniref:Putative SH3 domain-containing protein C23A1.17 n=2 Tax=Davidia involucrata TaxID=16924 RepID=A0A5B6YJ03_DAVIN
MAMSSSPPDPSPPTTATTTTTTITATVTAPRLFINPVPPPRDTRPPTTPLVQPPQPHYHHPTTYPSSSQQPLYTAQPIPNLAPRVPTNSIHPQLAKPHDHPPGLLYPVASSGRGFLPKAVRPQSVDQTVTIANPGGFPPRPVISAAYHHPGRPFGFPQSEPQCQTVHLIRPTHLQHTLLGSTGGVMTGMVKGIPVSAHPKVAPSPPSVSDCNGYKDIRDRSRDDTLTTVRDRKVRISDGSSLYALCRSWLRNGFPEESQPQYMDGIKSLPRPLPIPVADTHSAVKKEGDKEEEEEEGYIANLSPQDLLQGHIKRAKRVRARLREERLQRIARYKSRLALLLPPLVEQQFRNDTASGN